MKVLNKYYGPLVSLKWLNHIWFWIGTLVKSKMNSSCSSWSLYSFGNMNSSQILRQYNNLCVLLISSNCDHVPLIFSRFFLMYLLTGNYIRSSHTLFEHISSPHDNNLNNKFRYSSLSDNICFGWYILPSSSLYNSIRIIENGPVKPY